MTYTGRGALFPDSSSGQWLPACLCLNNSLPQPEVSQALPLFLPTVSYCAWWINFSIEKMQPGWGERHRVMLSLCRAGGAVGCGCVWMPDISTLTCTADSINRFALWRTIFAHWKVQPWPLHSFIGTGLWSGQGQAPGTPKPLPCVSSALDFGPQIVQSGQILCEHVVMRRSFSTLGYKPVSARCCILREKPKKNSRTKIMYFS